jgi:excisionase family DNA binding protein
MNQHDEAKHVCCHCQKTSTKKPPITTNEAAKRLNSTDRFIRKIILSGALPAFRLGDKGFRIDPDDLEDYVAQQAARVRGF